jgi:hypothetical protein
MRVCEECGLTPLKKGRSKYCSFKCMGEARNSGATITCQQCSKVVKVWPKQAATKKFCSRSCQTAATHQRAKERQSKACPRCHVEGGVDAFGLKTNGMWHSYCKACAHQQVYERASAVEGRWKHGINKSKKCGQTWGLTFEQFAALVVLPCHYCGKPLNPTGTGLDRMDASRGYETDNVVPCCHRCNKVKMDHFSYEQMLKLAQVIRLLDQEAANAA